METFVLVLTIALVIFAMGAVIGAEMQDRVAEDQRRRFGQRQDAACRPGQPGLAGGA